MVYAVIMQRVEGAEGTTPDVERGVVVQGEEGRDASAMVPVAVAEDGQVDGGEVDAQHPGILGKEIVAAHVEEDVCATGFDEQRQSVLGADGALARGVLHQHGYGHSASKRAAVRSQIALMATAAGLSLCAKFCPSLR